MDIDKESELDKARLELLGSSRRPGILRVPIKRSFAAKITCARCNRCSRRDVIQTRPHSGLILPSEEDLCKLCVTEFAARHNRVTM